MRGKILVIGGDSLLGGSLVTAWRGRGMEALATTRRPAQLAQVCTGLMLFDLESDIRTFTIPASCSAAVLCAGMTSQEFCRREPARSRRVNVKQTARLAAALVSAGCFVVFISSSQVYDGSQPRRRSDEPVSPKTEYGRQKAEAEAAILSLGDRSAVVRLTKVFHPNLPILKSWREKLRAGETINPYFDYLCAPILLNDAVRVMQWVAEKEQGGVWQVSSPGDIPYASIAARLAKREGFDPSLVRPVPTPPNVLEHLPCFTTLDTTRLRDAFGLEMAPAADAIDSVLSA